MFALGCSRATTAPEEPAVEIDEAEDSKASTEQPSKPTSREVTDEEIDTALWGGPLVPEPLKKWRPPPADDDAEPRDTE